MELNATVTVNKPTRALTSYMLYTKYMLPKVKEMYPTLSYSQLGDIIASKWQAVSLDLKEFVGLMEKAEKSKEGEYKLVKKNKKVRDPNAPRPAATAYMYFTKEMYPLIKADQSDKSFVGVTKSLGIMWKAIKDNERKKYDHLAAADKVRYQKELELYKKQ
jgi:hypothetical protein